MSQQVIAKKKEDIEGWSKEQLLNLMTASMISLLLKKEDKSVIDSMLDNMNLSNSKLEEMGEERIDLNVMRDHMRNLIEVGEI